MSGFTKHLESVSNELLLKYEKYELIELIRNLASISDTYEENVQIVKKTAEEWKMLANKLQTPNSTSQ